MHFPYVFLFVFCFDFCFFLQVYLMEHYLRIAEASYQHTKAGE